MGFTAYISSLTRGDTFTTLPLHSYLNKYCWSIFIYIHINYHSIPSYYKHSLYTASPIAFICTSGHNCFMMAICHSTADITINLPLFSRHYHKCILLQSRSMMYEEDQSCAAQRRCKMISVNVFILRLSEF